MKFKNFLLCKWLYFLSLYAASFYSVSAEDLSYCQNSYIGDMNFIILVEDFLVYKFKNSISFQVCGIREGNF